VSSLTLLASTDAVARLAPRLDMAILFDDREDLLARLAALANGLPRQPRTLDLVGLTGVDHILRINDRPVDTSAKRVRAFWRELAGQDTLEQLGVTAVRLVGCATAVGTRARTTLATLAEIIELDVTGTTGLVSFADFAATGFGVSVPQLGTLFLDPDALSRQDLRDGARVVSAAQARDVLAMIDRHAGRALVDLLAVPHGMLALPSPIEGQFHHLELLLDHELVRAGDMVFPVDDPRGLRSIVEA
jgi:hypothetical protein